MSEQELREHLNAKMADVTLDTLRPFIDEALAEGGKGYGEICVALGAIAAAAAKAADRSPQGGITGFQAGAVFWEFVRQWGVFDEGPKKILCYRDVLYPQSCYKFKQAFDAETWTWLQDNAKKLLAESGDHAHPNVVAHWKMLAAGALPEGFSLTSED